MRPAADNRREEPSVLLVCGCSKRAHATPGQAPFALLIRVVMATICFWPMATSSRATQLRCADRDIVAAAEKTAEQQRVCMAVEEAFAFLRTVGIEPIGSLTIEVTDKPPPNFNHHKIGLYHPKTSEIRLLSYESALSAAQSAPTALRCPD